MLAKRIVPCLDIKDGKTVKGINFVNFRDAGDPVELGKAYSDAGADELVYLDITASHEGRKTFTELIGKVAANISIPFTVGGGINELKNGFVILTEVEYRHPSAFSNGQKKLKNVVPEKFFSPV